VSSPADFEEVRQHTMQVGKVLFPVVLLILGIVLGFVRARKAEGEKFAFVPFFICFALAFVGALVQLKGGAR